MNFAESNHRKCGTQLILKEKGKKDI